MTALRTPVADAYETHKKYWADTGSDISLPVDPFRIADRMGVPVFRTILGPKLSGYLGVDAKGEPEIHVNEAHSIERNRFTCAHELGHYVDAVQRGLFPRTPEDGPLPPFARDELATRGTSPSEIYANRYAAALLMPKSAVKTYIGEGMSSRELARRFRVSEQAMELRLKNLALQTL